MKNHDVESGRRGRQAGNFQGLETVAGHGSRDWNLFARPRCRALAGAALLAAVCAVAARGAESSDIENIRHMSLEQLLNVEVNSVSRSESTVGESPAAIFVITQEMIRRSGATTIPELFRMVPGMDVARLDNNKWMVASRGFNERFNGRMLVQMDGRTLYNPVFAGVYWDAVDYPLDDIERIEVIRGPGASVWGANAVNGIINIITKSAKDTQGGMLTLGGGSEERLFGGGRYGGKAGDDLYYRIYGKSFDRGDGQFSQAGDTHDAWWGGSTGARLDWLPSEKDTFTLDGGYSHDVAGRKDRRAMVAPPYIFTNIEDEVTSAGHVLGRWSHTISKESSWAVQTYWDHYERDLENLDIHLGWDIYDVDFQHQFRLGERQDIVWGAAYRHTDSHVSNSEADNGFAIESTEPDRSLDLYSAFVQDQISIVNDRLALTLGSKFEHNDFTGTEVQPSARLLWTPSKQQTVWAAVSRAVKTPSVTDDNIRNRLLPAAGANGTVTYPRIITNEELDSEELIAYELGWRVQATKGLSADIAAFYNVYNGLRTYVAQPVTADPDAPGARSLPLLGQNKLDGETYGVELATTWQVLDSWRLYGAYTFLEIQMHRDAGVAPSAEAGPEGNSPQQQAYLQSSWDLPHRTEFDLIGRYVDELSGFNPSGAPGVPDEIDSYVSLDARVAWRVQKNVEIAVVGQNLLDEHHPEAGTSAQVRSPLVEIERGVYGKITVWW